MRREPRRRPSLPKRYRAQTSGILPQPGIDSHSETSAQASEAPGPAHQRSLDATLDWSRDLLPPEAQAVFRRLAGFAGGWSLDAGAVVGSLGADPGSVAPLLARLVDHSLVVRDGDADRSRFRMLAPIAEYATGDRARHG